MAQTIALIRAGQQFSRRRVPKHPSRKPFVPSLLPTIREVTAPPHRVQIGWSRTLPHRPNLPRPFASRTDASVGDFGVSFLEKARKVVKKVAAPVTRVTEKALKPIVTPLRPAAAALAPVFAPVSLFLQPEQMGIKAQKSQELFTRSQRIGRVVAGVAATVVTGGALLSAAGPATAGAVTAGTTAAGAGTAAGTVAGGGGLLTTFIAGAKTAGSALLAKAGSSGVQFVTNALKGQGVAGDMAQKLAQEMANGERPVPPEIDAALLAKYGQPTQAGLLGLDTNTMMLFGIASVVGLVVWGATRDRR